MMKQGYGSILNMASCCSSIKSAVNRFSYGTSKAAVVGLTKSIAIDYVTYGIRCNAICPATVDTPSLQDRINTAADPNKVNSNIILERLKNIIHYLIIGTRRLYCKTKDGKYLV